MSPETEDLLGKWSGSSQLWLSPDEKAYESRSTAQVETVAQGQFVALSYTWELEDEPQDGLIVFNAGAGDDPTRSVWLDSWHTRNDVMVCEGTRGDDDTVSLQGSYPAPPGPDWGWRIEIEAQAGTSLVIRMINVSPEGHEALAVLGQYECVKGAIT